MTTNMIFGINLDTGFTHKARFITYKHKFYTPPVMAYALVISRYSVWVVWMLASLNGLDVK